MQKILAIDAGGTTTRAVIVDPSGHCLGYGFSAGGNPVSAGFDTALASLTDATEMAQDAGRPKTGTLSSALIAMAGASERMPIERIAKRLAALGVRAAPTIESDLLAMYYSGTIQPRGYTLVAGTGAVAGRIDDGRLEAVSGGAGWLVGDAGSGFWIGHQVARAVVSALDGRGADTALTGLLLAALKLPTTPERRHGRPLVLIDLIDALYAMRPVELSRFAPLAFQAGQDAVASEILAVAATELAGTLDAVRESDVDGPVVLGGSVLEGMLAGSSAVAASLKAKLATGQAELIRVADGVVGAAVLALLHDGIRVDSEIFDRIRTGVAQLRHESGSGEEGVG